MFIRLGQRWAGEEAHWPVTETSFLVAVHQLLTHGALLKSRSSGDGKGGIAGLFCAYRASSDSWNDHTLEPLKAHSVALAAETKACAGGGRIVVRLKFKFQSCV